jgi:hypothetical protein
MEYVKGVPITDYCDDKRLTLPERLELFRQVCAGVQHAHHKGIIHRDLKPANILVTQVEGHAVPKIIDFGLARATDHRLVEATLFTERGQIIGTPEYMSPEQTLHGNRDIDTRTDVYSLGVVLYELLAGELPFPPDELRRGGLLEIQRQIREIDPPRPSTRIGKSPQRTGWVGSLRGDLDWIVMRALEKDPNRRYQTALALADDLARHLRNEPVEARPPTMTYRVAKFVRKHRGAVAAAAAVLTTAVVGAAVSLWLLLETQHARRRAERAVEESNLQLARTQMNAIDQAAYWTSQSVDRALAPTLDEVMRHEIDGRPVLGGLPAPLRDPWGQEYRLDPDGIAGDWVVRSCGPNRIAGDADDLAVHDRLFAAATERRLAALCEARAGRLLDRAQEMLMIRRKLEGIDVVADPWGNDLLVDGTLDEIFARSAGPDGVRGNADDLTFSRRLAAMTVDPADVQSYVGRSNRIYTAVRLQHAEPMTLVNALRPYFATASPKDAVSIGSDGGRTLLLLGPPERVAAVLEQIRVIDRPVGGAEQGSPSKR